MVNAGLIALELGMKGNGKVVSQGVNNEKDGLVESFGMPATLF